MGTEAIDRHLDLSSTGIPPQEYPTGLAVLRESKEDMILVCIFQKIFSRAAAANKVAFLAVLKVLKALACEEV